MDLCMEDIYLKNFENLDEKKVKYDNEKKNNDVDKIEYNIDNENNKHSINLKKSTNLSVEENKKDEICEKGTKKDNTKEEDNEKKSKILNDSMNLKCSDDEKETKDDANEKYNKGDYEGALKIWERGLRTINYILSKKDELKNERLQTFQKLHSTYCSNIAQGYMKLNKYSECVKYSLLAQENDKNNIKIYFRLAKGYFMLGEYDKSIKVLNEGIKINNDNSLINLLVIVKKKKQTHLEKEKYMMKYIFKSLKENPLTDDEKNKNSFLNFFYTIYSLLTFLFTFISIFYKTFLNLICSTINKCKIKKE
ncbi:tetratricopeptide repeat family protein, putative [Plasmodium gallinaceum]|uniref:peptidylprolyl isomerase n=1 Tax=Plasmodium gallinaceum TaxID=5849 RepID=A0A1J1GZH5_PLAGA|nr:tetratricopeptide repeat family protein, putative [Plasmodium gallinaceum]CRG97695.1 tetratricopeptide repeat family protein, putative [Plasmodium gallinaceum]